ncbi:methyltransferase family protein [Sphingomonas qomolangmaensis]|uniref:Isoprenylcysteine carboxylmethyltransferase family protein n=1 Tax=Sphingomonas qomolangmaensis TaxID=2918765 RepID=A0ABY5LDD6_9SPHN|nr:isoprenylcysteine carboxylmethyltransferase family protein [Sphingomonas qomolangmaensis]UUL83850.1 isoprenylcysteine carboxylmethyltransferase family protein [Sphingomonas qomolangmaensis]
MTQSTRTSKGGLQRLDAIERIAITVIYAFLLYRFAGSVGDNRFNLAYLVAEGLVVVMVLCRRSTDQISIAPADWAVAFGGSFVGMMLVPANPLPGVLAWAAPAVVTVGLVVSMLAKLQLRRSFGIVAANRGIKTRGVYALVRHPMYLGYFLVYFGTVAMNVTIWNIVVVGLWTGLQLVRIAAEERLLRTDPAYQQHSRLVRYRLLPGIY